MKKFLLLPVCLVTFSASTVFAQITKGSVLIGGNVSFAWSKSEPTGSNDYTTRTLILNPSAGMALKENKIWGLGLLFGNGKTGNDQNGNEYNVYGGQVFYRPYLPLGKGFYLFGQTTGGFTTARQELLNNGQSEVVLKQKQASLSLFPGVSYAVSNKIHLEAGINNLVELSYTSSEFYNQGNLNQKNNGVSLDVNAGNSSPLAVGLRFLFRK